MTPPPGQLLARHDETVFVGVIDELLVRPAGHLRAVHPATVSAATKPAGLFWRPPTFVRSPCYRSAAMGEEPASRGRRRPTGRPVPAPGPGRAPETKETDSSMTRNDEHHELRTLLLLLAMAVGLLATGVVVYLTFTYTRLAEPLAVGVAVLTCLAGLVRTVATTARGGR